MLDIYQEMLSNCARLLVPVERRKEREGGKKGLFHVTEHQY